MNMIQPNGYRMAWAPAAPRLAVARPPSLGQNVPFLESPTVAIITDLIVGSTSAFYAWGLGRQRNNMSTLWYVVAAAAGMKLLHDISR
jgi:hypothetical protein